LVIEFINDSSYHTSEHTDSFVVIVEASSLALVTFTLMTFLGFKQWQ
jgi:hypothetical protein